MRTNPLDPSGRVLNVVLVVCGVAMLGAFFYPVIVHSLPFSVPPWVAMRAKKRAPLVHIGMTDAQVWSTLGLAGRGFQAHISGSGPAGAYPTNYVLWPGYVMHMRWDLRTKPATLVEFQFRDHL